MISTENGPPYPKPPLSKAYLAGDLAVEDVRMDTADAELLCGIAVDRVHAHAGVVRLTDGQDLPYDGLVLATGTQARRPEDSSTHVLATHDDAQRLATALDQASSMVVAGSGLLAAELASAARRRGLEVTLVARPDGWSRRLGMLGGILGSLLDADGVHIERGGGRLTDGVVLLEDGRRLEGDVVAAAIGGTPNDSLLPECRAPGGGILVDEHNRVAAGCLARPIVAAGDATVRRRPDGMLVRDATWTNALAQGAAAAAALLTEDVPVFDPVPYGWTEVGGIEIKVVGTIPVDLEPDVIDGDLADAHALLRWPGAAASVGYRLPIGRLRHLASTVGSTV